MIIYNSLLFLICLELADIDECMESTHTCISKDNCVNTIGSYECYCPRGYSGNGQKEGGCLPPVWHNPIAKVLIGKLVQ